MSFNNQELHSFLQVPGGENQDQASFLSISPQRSSSPRSIVNEQVINQQTPNNVSSNIGSFRTRSRAGTLPSRLYPNSIGQVNPSGSTQNYTPSFNESSLNNFDPNSLNFETLTIATNSSPGPEASAGSATQKTRLRSGSLFGLTDANSIWSTDTNGSTNSVSLPAVPPSHQNQQPSLLPISIMPESYNQGRISPIKQGGFFNIQEEQHVRARAYSTNNVPLNEQSHYYLQQFVKREEQSTYQMPVMDQLGTLGAVPEMMNARPRAQTFENGGSHAVPILRNFPQSSISEAPEHEVNINRLSTKSLLNEPLLRDNVDPRLMNWTSTYQDSSLGPTNTLIISNLPAHATTLFSLANLLVNFGTVLSVRLFTGQESALVEFETLESAMRAKAQLHHQELAQGFSCLVAFAKILPLQQQQQQNHQVPSPNLISHHNDKPPQMNQPMPQPKVMAQPQPQVTQNHHAQQPQGHVAPSIHVDNTEQEEADVSRAISEEPPVLADVVQDLFYCVEKMGMNAEDNSAIANIVHNALKYEGFDNELGPLPAPLVMRQFDAPKLRETRKLIDAGVMDVAEIEETAVAMLPELPELSSDYLGNTVVQKLFEFSCTSIKHIMLKEVSPYLAQMGVHKNGTWSAQKMISVASTPLQKSAVAESLKPYCAPLFNDQFGNYVIQCSLKFGSAWNDFIFEAILAKFWLIAQNRYGARAVRACLESHDITPDQTAILSAAILLHAEHLAINQNAALLITWFLDTCTLPNRHILLAPRLIPHLAQLCTHKLASLTILKILNNRNESEAKHMIVNALFGDPSNDETSKYPDVLLQILQDNTHGASFIFKVISNPQLEPEIRKHVINQVRSALTDLNVSTYQGYKRLMDEVGLSNRTEPHRHNRNHSTGGSSRSKSRSTKSPQSTFNSNNRRSIPNSAYKPNNQHMAPLMQMGPPPSQPQFNEYTDYNPQQPMHPHQQMYQTAPMPPIMTQNQQEMFPFEPSSQPPQNMQNDLYQMQGYNPDYGYRANHY